MGMYKLEREFRFDKSGSGNNPHKNSGNISLKCGSQILETTRKLHGYERKVCISKNPKRVYVGILGGILES